MELLILSGRQITHISLILIPLTFGLKTFQKIIRQDNFDQKCLIELRDGNLKYKKETRVRGDSTKTIFTMLAMVTRRTYKMLDTQWFEMDHEGKPILGRFLWAGTENNNHW